MTAIRLARGVVAAVSMLALTGCGPAGNQPSNIPLTEDQQQFGKPQVEVTSSPRTPQQALAGAILSGSGAVPLILFKSNALHVENVFQTQPSMDVCTRLMNEHVKRVRMSASRGPASYYCVPVQGGVAGPPKVVAEYSS
jgi:hypothetical protein